MREIKLRALDTREGKMMSVGTWSPGVGVTEDDRWGSEGHYIPQCRLILMQYTGLKDKQGREIYEGDIVHSKRLNGCGEVKFGKAHFFIVTRNGTAMGWQMSADADELEIIGNIYENPDLVTSS